MKIYCLAAFFLLALVCQQTSARVSGSKGSGSSSTSGVKPPKAKNTPPPRRNSTPKRATKPPPRTRIPPPPSRTKIPPPPGRGVKTTTRRNPFKTTIKKKGKSVKVKSYQEAIAAGLTVRGMFRYQSKFKGTKYYVENPNVCFNNGPGLAENGLPLSHQGYFVCPYKDTDSATHTKCCGPDEYQHCCVKVKAPGSGTTKLTPGIAFGMLLTTAVTVRSVFV